jgi:hypothetical protein
MSQRLINVSTAGETIVLRGSAPEDDEQNGTSGSESGSAGSEGGSSTGSEGAGNEGKGEKSSYSKEEYEAIDARMKAADRRAAAAEAKISEAEKAKMTDDQRKDLETKETQAKAEALVKENSELLLKVAFLSINDVSWHNPALVMGQIDFSKVADEDGKIDQKALKAEVKRIATEQPYLVKTDQAVGGTGGHGTSGGTVGSGNKSGDKAGPLSEDELRRRYPALYV